MSIKAVAFDFGQVISLPQDPTALDRIAEKIGVPRETFEPLLWNLRGEYDRGKITSREYYRDILSRLNVSMSDTAIDELTEIDLASWRNINPDTEALMRDIKKAGYTLAILSNMPHDFLAWARKNLPVFSLPHAGLFSCEAGMIKPEKAIYTRLLSMLDIESKELVFFDDKEENIESAAALGIEAFLWKTPEAARRELVSLGVRL